MGTTIDNSVKTVWYFRAPYMCAAMRAHGATEREARADARRQLCHAHLPKGTTICRADTLPSRVVGDAK